ncbi:MAG: PilZ domain-containing protein [Myxococcota bacterium]
MERRRRYRVRLPDEEPIQVSLAVPGWPAVPARLRDASALGVGLEIPAELPLAIDEGGTVDLTVWLLRDHRAVDVDAVVVDEARDDGVRHLGLRFAAPSDAERDLGRDFGTIFNRRRTPRVAVDSGTRVTVQPVGGGRDAATAATARDLSETGVGLEIPAGRGDVLDGQRPWDLSLALDARPLRLRARLRHRRLHDGRMACGLEFDPIDSPETRAGQSVLREYVSARLA